MNYSERIWKNQRFLAYNLRKEMIAAVHRGESIEKISSRIAKRMDTGISNARRLVRTELNYVHNHAALDSIADSGMKYFRFIATLDKRTSEICRSHDSHVYPISEAKQGQNVPPLHPNCRSTIAGSLRGPGSIKTGTRAARNEQGKTIFVPSGMSYDDWKAVYVDKSQTLTDWGKAHMPQSETKPAVADIIKTWTSIQGLHTTEEDLLRVNPNYSKDGQYKVNCQRCVQTYELRRRGYDVSAMPKPTDAGANPVIWGAECFVKPNAGESFADAAYNKFTFGQTTEDIQKVLENAPRNCRYVIYVQWQKVKASHVFIAQKDNGVIRYIDPQTGDSDVKRYFEIGKNSNFGYCRLDNKPITDNNEILRSTVKGEKNDSK